MRAKAHIVLVHGTWGQGFFRRSASSARRRPFWFEEGSAFRERLGQELAKANIDAELSCFRWSGANSVAERRRAATELASTIEQRHAEAPDLVQVVVGHSHGGSVAMLALNDMKEIPEKLLLATLATPFMEVHGAESSSFSRLIGYFTLFLGIAVGFWAAHALYLLPDNPAGGLLTFLYAILGSIVLLAAIFLSFMLVLWLFGSFDGIDESDDRARRLQAMTAGGLDWCHATAPLIIRAVDDEASLALAAGAIGNRLGRLLFSAVIRLLLAPIVLLLMPFGLVMGLYVWWLVIGYVFGFGGHVSPMDELKGFEGAIKQALEPHRPVILSAIGYMAGICLPAAFGAIILCGLFKSVYGRELVLGALQCEINSQSAPDISGKMVAVTLPPAGRRRRGLRHMIYEREEAPAVLASWLQAAMAAMPLNPRQS